MALSQLQSQMNELCQRSPDDGNQLESGRTVDDIDWQKQLKEAQKRNNELSEELENAQQYKPKSEQQQLSIDKLKELVKTKQHDIELLENKCHSLEDQLADYEKIL